MSSTQYPPLSASDSKVKQLVIPAVFGSLAIIAVILRLSSRLMKRKELAFNDYAVLIALLFTTGLITSIWLALFWAGAGHHITSIELMYRSRIFVIFAAGQPLWAAANTAVKFSILHLYVTIFPSERFRRICYTTMAFSMVYFISVLLETFMLCKPVRFNWDKTVPGTCDPNSLIAYIVAGTINLVIDIVVVVLPMPILWKLHLSWPKKIGVMSMFSLGGVICIITLLRVTYIARMNLLDFSYASVDLAIWSILEPTLGILNASLPVLRPVGSHIFESHALTWARNSFRSLLTQISTRGGTENSGSGRSWPRLSKKSTRDSFLRLGDPTDRLYPLDTINLGGSAEGQELETHREHSGKNDSQPFNA